MVHRPRLLYASPLWPVKSGISEYSEVLLNGLEEYFDVSLLIDKYKLTDIGLYDRFNVITYESNRQYDGYNYTIYNIGNNPDAHGYMLHALKNNPGHLILHDLTLFYLMAAYYEDQGCFYRKIYEMEGASGISALKESFYKQHNTNILLHKDLPEDIPLNRELLERAASVFVHSEYTASRVNRIAPKTPVHKIPFVNMDRHDSLNNNKLSFKSAFGIPDEAFVIASVGFIAPTKQNQMVCEAVQCYNSLHSEPIYYLLAGEGDYVDSYLGPHIVKTGFLDQDAYYNAIERSNLIFNLRYPSYGESSGTVIQCMAYGKLCVVTDDGWFHELPDNVVDKIPSDVSVQALVQYLERIIPKLQANNDPQHAAMQYVQTCCAPDVVAQDIFTALACPRATPDTNEAHND